MAEFDDQAVSARQIDLRDEIEDVFKKAVAEKARLYAHMATGQEITALRYEFVNGFYLSFNILYEMTNPAFETNRKDDKNLETLLNDINEIILKIAFLGDVEKVSRDHIKTTLKLYDQYKPYLVTKNLLKIA